ncbi:hypothetical protein ACQJBY_035912 [Aegilops geniculata]
MWRSFLARSQPLLSHVRRGPSGCSAAAGDTLVAAGAHPRAYASSAAEADVAANSLRTTTTRRRHLYVVLDEMKTGRSIYILDVDDLDGGDEDAVTGMDSPRRERVPQTPPPCQLPEPVLRLGYTLIGSWAHFSAVGGKIVVTGSTRRGDYHEEITLVYDTKTARLDMGQPPPAHFTHQGCHVAAVGNKLYRFGGGSVCPPHYLSEQQVVELHGGYESHNDDRTMLRMRGQIMEWSWKNAPSLPAGGGGYVQSCAVHPDGRTLFVSRGPVTYSLDTEQQWAGEWTRRGDWAMPFHGRAYYDAHLDAWVGTGPRNDAQDLNYLCSCEVPNLAGDQPPKPLPTPEWRVCKEELTFLEGASSCALLHTGRGRFCLVEARPVVPLAEAGAKDSQCNRCTMHNGNDHLLHVTMFCAKHGRDGELVMAPCRPGRSYLVPHYAEDADEEDDPVENPPAAFWI